MWTGIGTSAVDQPPRQQQLALHAPETHAHRCSPVHDSPVLVTRPASPPAQASSFKRSAAATSGVSLKAAYGTPESLEHVRLSPTPGCIRDQGCIEA